MGPLLPMSVGAPELLTGHRQSPGGRKREWLNDFVNDFTRPPFPNHWDQVTPVKQAPDSSSPSYVSIIPLWK